MDESLRAAHIDESGARLPSDRRLYIVCASLTMSTVSSPIQEVLRIAGIPLDGVIVVMTTCARETQEDARRQLLGGLVPRLQHEEGITHVVIESRGGSDSLDKRTVERLRRSRHLTGDLRVDHRRKALDPLLWVPDFVAGCWIGAQHHSEAEPWQILNTAHMIEIQNYK